MRVAKTYSYIDNLIMEVLNIRELSDVPLDQPAIMERGNPKCIRPNLSKVPHPPKADLVEKHKSRFSK